MGGPYDFRDSRESKFSLPFLFYLTLRLAGLGLGTWDLELILSIFNCICIYILTDLDNAVNYYSGLLLLILPIRQTIAIATNGQSVYYLTFI